MDSLDHTAFDPAEYTRSQMEQSARWCRMGHRFTGSDPEYRRRILARIQSQLEPGPLDLWKRIPWIWAGTLELDAPLAIDVTLAGILAAWLEGNDPLEQLVACWDEVAHDAGPPLSCVLSSHPYADVIKWSHLRSCPWS